MKTNVMHDLDLILNRKTTIKNIILRRLPNIAIGLESNIISMSSFLIVINYTIIM